jgi:hypothetical protein
MLAGVKQLVINVYRIPSQPESSSKCRPACRPGDSSRGRTGVPPSSSQTSISASSRLVASSRFPGPMGPSTAAGEGLQRFPIPTSLCGALLPAFAAGEVCMYLPGSLRMAVSWRMQLGCVESPARSAPTNTRRSAGARAGSRWRVKATRAPSPSVPRHLIPVDGLLMTTSTRRFCCRPAAESLSATGSLRPLPDAESRIEPIPCPARYDFTELARRSDSPWL